ncbi:MAG: hypothetical protein SFU87_19705 [Chitinophagaceae bacterium]|nr:hypothetical protein [Chitinophagaceae bacterium]
MQRICILLSLFSIVSGAVWATSDSLQPLLHNLLQDNKPVAYIRPEGSRYFEPGDLKDKPPGNFLQCLIKNSDGLFIYLDGSGRLYKALQDKKTVRFRRIDSTIYFGHNFDAFTFSYRDTIYSLGGYGFWETNGLLRYYADQKREWEVIRLNMEIPLRVGNSFDLIWFDQAQGNIYFGFTRHDNIFTKSDSTSATPYSYDVVVLDMKIKEWRRMGILSSFLRQNIPGIKNMTSSPFGQMIALGNSYLFLNYKENKIFQLKSGKKELLDRSPILTFPNCTFYFKDSTLYFGTSEKGLLDSVSISINDISSVEENIFTDKISMVPGTKKNTTLLLLYLLPLLLAFIAFMYWKSKKSNKLKVADNSANEGQNKNVKFNSLTEKEADLIKFIVENSKKQLPTTIDEINKLLGVANKNIEIQKKKGVIQSVQSIKNYLFLKIIQKA